MKCWKFALVGVALLAAATLVGAPRPAEAGHRNSGCCVDPGAGYRDAGYGAYGYNYGRQTPDYRIGTFYKPYNYSYPRYWWYYTPAYSYYGYHPYRWQPYAYFEEAGWRPRAYAGAEHRHHRAHHHAAHGKQHLK